MANTSETTKIVLVFASFEDVSFFYFYAYIVSTFMLFLCLYCFYALRFPKNNHNQVKLICLPASHSFS